MEDLSKNLTDAKLSSYTVQGILSTVKRLTEDGIDWATVDDQTLIRVCSSTSRLRDIRCALKYAFTAPEALRRWPGLYTNTQFTPRFSVKAVSAEIDSIPYVKRELIDMDILIQALKHPDSSFAHKASSLYMQCWGVAFQNLSPVPSRIRAMILFRWGGDREIIEVFHRMAQSAVDHGGRNALLRLLNAFYKLCILLQPSGVVSDRIKSVLREEIVAIIADRGSQFLKGQSSGLFYQFAPGGRWYGLILPWRDWRPVKCNEVAYKRKHIERERQSLTWLELQALFRVTQDDARDDALLRYYIHTSRRRQSACELLVKDVWNPNTGIPLAGGIVLEKNNERVRFPIDEVLGAAFKRWIRTIGDCEYVFPSPVDGRHKWGKMGPFNWLHKICNKAGISGSHIHVHALRHTVATLLHKSGNQIEDISAFLGHRSVDTTQLYIDRSVSRSQDRMAIPWLTRDVDMAGMRLSATTIAVVSEQAGDTRGSIGPSSSSSSSSTAGIESVMIEATQQQQQLVLALTRQLADRDEQLECLRGELGQMTETYNCIVGQILTDAQRLTLGDWQRSTAGPPMAPTWQETLTQTYTGVIPEDNESNASSDESEEAD